MNARPLRKSYSPLVDAMMISTKQETPLAAIRVKVRELLKQANVESVPVQIKPLCTARGIKRIFSHDIEWDARLFPAPDGYSICINRQYYDLYHEKAHTRFSICHEIAHTFFLELETSNLGWRAGTNYDFRLWYAQEEILCNRAAGEMLVPTEKLKSMTMDIWNPFFLAEYFKVSKEVIFRRLSEIMVPNIVIAFLKPLRDADWHLKGFQVDWCKAENGLKYVFPPGKVLPSEGPVASVYDKNKSLSWEMIYSDKGKERYLKMYAIKKRENEEKWAKEGVVVLGICK
ncbi:MAG: ImmA/IrrE family metallo-endopeptidase [Candidatus Aenigmarchaeota archaeon]|nr:ImmA/IrrE family metallo-endopeptidase [Candidatus Aenigmarchaeota archaeon]